MIKTEIVSSAKYDTDNEKHLLLSEKKTTKEAKTKLEKGLVVVPWSKQE